MSPGVAIGPARALAPTGQALPDRTIPAGDVAAQLERLDGALEAARNEAQHACDDARRRLGSQYGDILAAHARMIADPTLRAEARTRIVRDQIVADHAVVDVLEGYAARLEQLSDGHLASRAADIRDVLHRILKRLRKPVPSSIDDTAAATATVPSLILAHDLSPSATAALDTSVVLGFATEAGGQTSHTAIVAAGLEIPAVVGIGRFLERARQASRAIIDGDEGLVILDPDAATLRQYRKASRDRAARFASLAGLAGLPSQTRDGTTIHLHGNIEFPSEVAGCLQWGAEGIGLYRTEFLYLGSDRLPSEEEQYDAYARVVRPLQGRPVVIRTLDLGADKVHDSLAHHRDDRNPALGLRSIRLSLREPAAFRIQVRAILRAGALGDVRILLPLIATLGEWRRARCLIADVAAELAADGVAYREVPLGAMIEVPSAALMADHLAREVDFFSIGTNDLTQYTLAVDRTNETVADLYNAAEPAVLRLIRLVMEAARIAGKPVNLCGSIGGDPQFTRLLVGMGLRALSMPPHQLPAVKHNVRSIALPQAVALARELLELDTAEAVANRLREPVEELQPDLEYQFPGPKP